jgi:hypothetical protein
MHHFSVIKLFPFPASHMWSIFSDFSKSTNPSAVIELVEEGDPDNYGIGAIRSTRIGKDTFREQLIAYKPEQSLTYQLLSGAPVEDYYGTITIRPVDEDHAEVEWSVECKPNFPIPAWIIEKNAKKVIKGILDELLSVLTQSDNY